MESAKEPEGRPGAYFLYVRTRADGSDKAIRKINPEIAAAPLPWPDTLAALSLYRG